MPNTIRSADLRGFADTIVLGGGLVGSAVAYGLGALGQKVLVLDEGDVAYRASRGNFGLVWVQSKGAQLHEYARWTRSSAELWPGFAERLEHESGLSPNYHKAGGVHLCFSQGELEEQRAINHRMGNAHGGLDYGAKILGRAELEDLLPGLGPDVVGGNWSPNDGHANPLALLQALHRALQVRDGVYLPRAGAQAIKPENGIFTVHSKVGTFSAPSIVMAAGLGNRELGASIGMTVPVWPLKGQILVTEKAPPRLSMPTNFLRQTDEGSFLLGDSHEHSGFDTRSTSPVMADIAASAVRSFPYLADLRIIRGWGALRVMTSDGLPIYQQSQDHPGAFVANCHSGVTLAAAHALRLAPMIAQGALDRDVSAFTTERFSVH
jgi:glycine/D-amino acid oxidase-like deaminating enzyme